MTDLKTESEHMIESGNITKQYNAMYMDVFCGINRGFFPKCCPYLSPKWFVLIIIYGAPSTKRKNVAVVEDEMKSICFVKSVSHSIIEDIPFPIDREIESRYDISLIACRLLRT